MCVLFPSTVFIIVIYDKNATDELFNITNPKTIVFGKCAYHVENTA